MHIAKDSASAADRFIDQLHGTFQRIARGEVSGEKFFDSQNREARRITHGSYVITTILRGESPRFFA